MVSGRASEPASAAWIDPVAVGRDGRRRRRSARVLERTSPRRGPRPSRTPTGSAARRARRWWPRDGRGVRRTAAIAPRALQLVRAAHDPRPCPATTSPRRRPSPSPSSSTSAARPLGPPRTRRGHDGRSRERTRLSPSRVRLAGGSPTLPEGSGCLWQTHRPPPAGAGSVVNRCGGGWSAMADAPSTPWREPSPAAGGHRRCARTQIGKSTDRRLSDPNPAGQWRVSGACSAAMASAAVCNIILFASSRTVVNLNLTIPLGALFGHFLPVLSAHKLRRSVPFAGSRYTILSIGIPIACAVVFPSSDHPSVLSTNRSNKRATRSVSRHTRSLSTDRCE